MFGNDPDNARGRTIALVIAFLIAGLIFISDRSSDRLLVRTQMQADAAIAPGLVYLSMPLRAIEEIATNFTDRSRALAENKALKEELYALREDKERSEIAAMKLSRFEQILGANPGMDIPKQKIAARMVSEINGPFVRSALINAGSLQGIKKGHPVMTVDGLFGHVLRTGSNSSRVLQLGDLNSRIAVMSSRSQATAILSGDNNDFPILAFISDTADWQIGDKIVTSGDGGILPRGLAVGVVVRDDENRLVAKLNVTGKAIDWVWIYPFTRIPTPEENTPLDSSETNLASGKVEGTP